MYLNNQHVLIECINEFFGTIDGASVFPREIVKRALSLNAAAVIFAHNHPSGNPQPSGADLDITKTLQNALGLLDIRVLDHIIAAKHSVYSFAESGKI
jgi:DNA repair protein RadC